MGFDPSAIQSCFNCYWSDFDQTLKEGSWDNLLEPLAVNVTVDEATFVLVTFVHIRIISAVTDTIFTKH